MKQVLIVGAVTCCGYKDVFPYIRSREVKFRPQIYGLKEYINSDKKFISVWYTTMEIPYIEPLELTKTYNPEDYPKLDNYDVIEVSKTKNIPKDYDGVMAVPITFLDKFNPKQFEIVGLQCRHDNPYKTKIYSKEEFENANDLNKSGIIIKDGKMKMMYYRIMIKKR
jgi:hypothetical protein